MSLDLQVAVYVSWRSQHSDLKLNAVAEFNIISFKPKTNIFRFKYKWRITIRLEIVGFENPATVTNRIATVATCPIP